MGPNMLQATGDAAPGLDGATSDDLVVLVDEHDQPVGTAPRASVHTADTPLHRAFSMYLRDQHGRVLLTRRALTKTTWPGVWTNSACGHLRPGEDAYQAAERRIPEELGVHPEQVEMVLPNFRYRATDASGLVEHELCPVLVGTIDAEALRPAPDEVADHVWVQWDELRRVAEATPGLLSPWSVLQIRQLGKDPWSLVEHNQQHLAPASSALGEDSGATLERTLTAVDARLWARLHALVDDWASLAAGSSDVLGAQDLPTLILAAAQGGKRIRPAMVHWGWVAAGAPAEYFTQMIDLGTALELLHLFALVHDDVMDRSGMRRGRPTVRASASQHHRDAGALGSETAFGDNIAILVGDLLHAEADALVAGLAPEVRDTWHTMVLELVLGQRRDLTGAALGRRDLDQALEVSHLKSGAYTVQRPLQLGALLGGAGPRTVQCLVDYGRHAGAAFGLRDDILGTWGHPEQTGKSAADDLEAGKPTVLLALAAERLAPAERALLGRTGTGDLDQDQLARLRTAMDRCGVRDQVEELVADQAQQATAVLDEQVIGTSAAAGLRRMVEHLAWRQS